MCACPGTKVQNSKEKGGGEGSPKKCIILKTSFLVVPSNGGKEGRKTEKEGGRERGR